MQHGRFAGKHCGKREIAIAAKYAPWRNVAATLRPGVGARSAITLSLRYPRGNVAATLPRQCWNASYLAAQPEATVPHGASSLNLEKFRYGRKRVRSSVITFLSAFLARYIRARALRNARDRIVEKCDATPSFTRDPVEIKNRKFLSRFTCTISRRDIAETLEKYTLSKYIYTYPAKEMISSIP